MPSALTLGVRDVSVAYGKGAVRAQALENISVEFAPGTLNLVMGPSGSGKTTLLSLLGCLLTPDTGSVLVGGDDVGRLSASKRNAVRQRKIGFVFQAFRLFHSLNAEENIALSAQIAGMHSRRERLARSRQLLADFGMEGKARLKPNQLSGGEKQRVAIARAVIKDPPILLADEPTASLDSRAAQQISQILRDLAEKSLKTIVVVSHDPRWEQFAHRTIVLSDGRILEDRKTQS